MTFAAFLAHVLGTDKPRTVKVSWLKRERFTLVQTPQGFMWHDEQGRPVSRLHKSKESAIVSFGEWDA